jgi:hypothetical protein
LEVFIITANSTGHSCIRSHPSLVSRKSSFLLGLFVLLWGFGLSFWFFTCFWGVF